MSGNPQWPELPLSAWSGTCDTLQCPLMTLAV